MLVHRILTFQNENKKKILRYLDEHIDIYRILASKSKYISKNQKISAAFGGKKKILPSDLDEHIVKYKKKICIWTSILRNIQKKIFNLDEHISDFIGDSLICQYYISHNY